MTAVKDSMVSFLKASQKVISYLLSVPEICQHQDSGNWKLETEEQNRVPTFCGLCFFQLWKKTESTKIEDFNLTAFCPHVWDSELKSLDFSLRYFLLYAGARVLDMASWHPILDTRISFVCPSICPSGSGDPPWILKRDGLVESHPPNIGKLRGYNFFGQKN